MLLCNFLCFQASIFKSFFLKSRRELSEILKIYSFDREIWTLLGCYAFDVQFFKKIYFSYFLDAQFRHEAILFDFCLKSRKIVLYIL